MSIVHFTTLAGATIYFPPNGLKPRKVRLESAFHARLEAMFSDLWQRCPWGQAQWIGSLGCMVPSTPGHDTGRHDSGEAFDLASVRWPGRALVHATDPSAQAYSRYLAVEAVARLHFQTALDWWFGAEHRDHWHIDTGHGEPTWEGRSNQVCFLQASLRYVWGVEGLKIDGAMGPKTRTALQSCFAVALVGAGWWPAFLEETARRGFAL